MGSASSISANLSDEKQFALFQELKIEYEKNADNGKSEEENFQYYKKKYEAFLDSQNEGKPPQEVEFCLGDIVSTNGDGEGIILDKTEIGFKVDIGRNELVELPASKLKLILSGLDYEVGDKVQVRPVGSATFYTGHVVAIHKHLEDGGLTTYDVEMLGEAGDMEKSVLPTNMRKVLSHRLIKRKLRKLINTVHAVAAFAHKSPGSRSSSLTPPGAAEAKLSEAKSPESKTRDSKSDESLGTPVQVGNADVNSDAKEAKESVGSK